MSGEGKELDFSFLDENVFAPLRKQGELNPKAFRTIAWEDTSPETNWIRVQYTYEVMRDNLHGASIFPGSIAAIIRSRAWEKYEFRGKIIEVSSFREFVETAPPRGLGISTDELIRLCKKYPAVVEMIDIVLKEEAHGIGRPRKKDEKKGGYNIPPFSKSKRKGTSLQRSLRRLRNLAEEDPRAAELRQKVLRGEMSANQALVQLGKRRRRFGVEASPQSVITFVSKHLSKDEIRQVISELETLLD